eukprot:3473611-Amphidinium_carterae.1
MDDIAIYAMGSARDVQNSLTECGEQVLERLATLRVPSKRRQVQGLGEQQASPECSVCATWIAITL